MSSIDDVLKRKLAADNEDPIPDSILEAAAAIFDLRRLDHEDVAVLMRDTAQAVPVRAAAIETLTFVAEKLIVELEITDDMVIGQVLPPAEYRVTHQIRGGRDTTTTTDSAGTFRLDRTPGIQRIVINNQPSDTSTEWWTL